MVVVVVMQHYIAGLVEAAETLPDVNAVLRQFHVASLQRHIAVDVVCCQGQTWVKVVARNNKALTTDLNGMLHFRLNHGGDDELAYWW